MERWKERRRGGKEERREERRGDMRYLGWVSTPCNLSSLARKTSCDTGRSSTQ